MLLVASDEVLVTSLFLPSCGSTIGLDCIGTMLELEVCRLLSLRVHSIGTCGDDVVHWPDFCLQDRSLRTSLNNFFRNLYHAISVISYLSLLVFGASGVVDGARPRHSA